MKTMMNKLVFFIFLSIVSSGAFALDNYIIPGLRFRQFDSLTQMQQRLFTGYFKATHNDASESAADFWNRSAESANNETTNDQLLSQSQLATYIGVTSMWEHSGTIDLVESVDEIRDLSDHDGHRIIGTFVTGVGAGEYINSNWKSGGISKSIFKIGKREPIWGHVKGQFTMTSDLKRFNSDVDYHPPKFFWFHGKRENSDIRRTGGLHRHLESHIIKYGGIYGDNEFPIFIDR